MILSLQLPLFICLAVLLSILFIRSFLFRDIFVIVFLLVATIGHRANFSTHFPIFVLYLVGGIAVGKGITWMLNLKDKQKSAWLIVLILFISFSSIHYSDALDSCDGPRWMGLWNNPNDCGILMSVGILLAVGLLLTNLKPKVQNPKTKENYLHSLHSFVTIKPAILLIAIGMMAMGLVMSFSRGAWLGMATGLLYMARTYGRFKWRYVAPAVGIAALGVLFTWGRTSDSAPWYLKRMDFSRPSAQHRITAWEAGFKMMLDHPFGIGWNKAVETYEKNYSPPNGGAAALITNDYLMLGTQLGIPALFCFLAYVALQLGAGKWLADRRWKLGIKKNAESRMKNEEVKSRVRNSEFRIKVACRAAVIAMLVEFWFDGGLFKLATASVFWILLELGSSDWTETSPLR